MSLILTGCETFRLTRTTDQIASEAEVRIVRDVCGRAWKPQSYCAKVGPNCPTVDSADTIKEIRASNRAREAFCK